MNSKILQPFHICILIATIMFLLLASQTSFLIQFLSNIVSPFPWARTVSKSSWRTLSDTVIILWEKHLKFSVKKWWSKKWANKLFFIIYFKCSFLLIMSMITFTSFHVPLLSENMVHLGSVVQNPIGTNPGLTPNKTYRVNTRLALIGFWTTWPCLLLRYCFQLNSSMANQHNTLCCCQLAWFALVLSIRYKQLPHTGWGFNWRAQTIFIHNRLGKEVKTIYTSWKTTNEKLQNCLWPIGFTCHYCQRTW